MFGVSNRSALERTGEAPVRCARAHCGRRPLSADPLAHPQLAWEDKCPYTTGVRFEWDPRQAKANLRTHGMSFAEAVTVLEDDFALSREDPDVEERRFVTLGLSNIGNLLVMVYAYREPDIIRVISAWKASKSQRRRYEKGRG